MANWFYQVDGVRQGPVSEMELQTLAAQGAIAPDTVVSNEAGQSAYARNVRGLVFPHQDMAEPPIHNMATPFSDPAPGAVPPPSFTPSAVPPPPAFTPPSATPMPFSSTIPAPDAPVPDAGNSAPGVYPPGASDGKILFMEAATRIPGIALANLVPLLANIVCFILVSWVPWINLGALIGLFAVSAKVASPEGLSPTEVLSPKYRGMLGNFVVLFSLMAGGVMVVFIGLLLPLVFFGPLTGIVQVVTQDVPVPVMVLGVIFAYISGILAMLSVFVGWILAPLLVCDRNADPSEALSKSAELMDGNKLTFCGLALLYGFFFAILGGICGLLTGIAPLAGIPLLLCLNVFANALCVAMVGYFYGKLATETA